LDYQHFSKRKENDYFFQKKQRRPYKIKVFSAFLLDSKGRDIPYCKTQRE
jgi:hypothetical protein